MEGTGLLAAGLHLLAWTASVTVVAPLAGALVFSKAGSYAGQAASTDGFASAIAVSGALSLAGAVAALAIPGPWITRLPPAAPALTPIR